MTHLSVISPVNILLTIKNSFTFSPVLAVTCDERLDHVTEMVVRRKAPVAGCHVFVYHVIDYVSPSAGLGKPMISTRSSDTELPQLGVHRSI